MRCSFCGASLTIMEIDFFEDECDKCRNETEKEYWERVYEISENDFLIKGDSNE